MEVYFGWVEVIEHFLWADRSVWVGGLRYILGRQIFFMGGWG